MRIALISEKIINLTIYFEKIVKNFSRHHKYTLGNKLRDKNKEIEGLTIKDDYRKE